MRRLMPIAVFALFLAVPLWAQHGGGHGGGGHAGGSGGHAGFGGGSHMGGGGHASGGMHSAPGAAHGFSRGSLQRGVSRQPFRDRRNNFRNNTFRTNRFRDRNRFRTFGFRNCVGFGCRGFGYPWAYGGYYDPYWWWDSDSSYDDSYDHDRAIANDMNAQSLDEQRMRRQEEADGDQDAYAPSSAAPRPVSAPQSSPITPPTVLVFRDQHKEEIRNYAIVGQTLWNFSPQRTEKISISDLDLTATTKANDDRGLSFRVPDSALAQ